MALIAELQPVARSPFSRILTTASFNSSCVGASVRKPFKAVGVPLNRCGAYVVKVKTLSDELLKTWFHVSSRRVVND